MRFSKPAIMAASRDRAQRRNDRYQQGFVVGDFDEVRRLADTASLHPIAINSLEADTVGLGVSSVGSPAAPPTRFPRTCRRLPAIGMIRGSAKVAILCPRRI